MKVTQAEMIISAAAPHQFPQDTLPEIALAGRSNVGKSSLINRMLQRKSLARTSSQPGKTQTLNYYRINEQLYFVDFPGYGYAKVSKVQRKKWGELIEAYLRERETLRLVLLVIDLRHAPTEDDCLMYDWMQHFNIPCLVVATKADKLPRSKWQKHLRVVCETLGMPEGEQPLLFSSESGLGREELWSLLMEAIAQNITVMQETEEEST